MSRCVHGVLSGSPHPCHLCRIDPYDKDVAKQYGGEIVPYNEARQSAIETKVFTEWDERGLRHLLLLRRIHQFLETGTGRRGKEEFLWPRQLQPSPSPSCVCGNPNDGAKIHLQRGESCVSRTCACGDPCNPTKVHYKDRCWIKYE